MSAIEIHISAERLARRFGHRAWARAADQAEAAAALGDWEQVAIWRRIAGAVHQIEAGAARRVANPNPLKSLVALIWTGFSAEHLEENPIFG